MSFIDNLTPSPPFRYGENADRFNQMLIRVLIPVKYGAPWGDLDMADYTSVEYSDYQQGIANLDPDVPPNGPIQTRWRLRVNLPMEPS